MKIGIGGSLGPFRVGVSNRGFGVGAGPLSAGSGWGRRRSRRRASNAAGEMGCLGWAIGITCIYFLVAWPWLLGSWIAVQLGAGMDSVARSATGWVFEGVVVALLIWMWLSASAASARRAAEQEQARVAAERAAQWQAAKERKAALRGLVERAELYPTGRNGQLADFYEVDLVEPRVTHRGGPKAQTRIDTGRLEVTTTEVSFHGATKFRQWRWKDIASIETDGDFQLMPVRSRSTISGVAPSSTDAYALPGALTWGRALSLGEAPESVVRHLQQTLASAGDTTTDFDH